jgi:hypothetical protein
MTRVIVIGMEILFFLANEGLEDVKRGINSCEIFLIKFYCKATKGVSNELIRNAFVYSLKPSKKKIV